MLTFDQAVRAEFLQARCLLLELGSLLDRIDEAAARSGCSASDDKSMRQTIDALKIAAAPASRPNRAERLLRHYSDPE